MLAAAAIHVGIVLAVMILVPLNSSAEIREFAVTDVTQIAGTWEGSAAYAASRTRASGSDTGVTVTIKADGTWQANSPSGIATNGTFTLKDGRVRFQVLTPQPPGWSNVGTWAFYENAGRLSMKSTRDDNNVTGDFVKK